MKIAEKQRTCTMLSSDSVQHIVSYARGVCVCVCDVRFPNFAPFYLIDNNGRH